MALQQIMEKECDASVKIEFMGAEKCWDFSKETQCLFKISVAAGKRLLTKALSNIIGTKRGKEFSKGEAFWTKGIDGTRLFHNKLTGAYFHFLEKKWSSRRRGFSCAVVFASSLMLEEILKNNVNSLVTSYSPHTPIHNAASHGRIKNIKVLLNYGANPNAKGFSGSTPISWACTDMIHILTSAEDVEMEDACVVFGQMIEVLVKNGADINAKDNNGWTPLQKSLSDSMGWPEAIEKFIELGVDLEATDLDGETALHAAAVSGYPAIVEALVKAGANVDVQNDYGETSLHLLLREPDKYFFHYDDIKTLLDLGARIDIPDCIGETAESLGVMNLLRNPPKPKVDQGWYF